MMAMEAKSRWEREVAGVGKHQSGSNGVSKRPVVEMLFCA